MTFKEKLKELLVQHGMWEEQSLTVMERVKADESNEAMNGHWDDQVDGCPPQMLAVLWMSVRAEALAYIDETCPKAWFRPMFTQ